MGKISKLSLSRLRYETGSMDSMVSSMGTGISRNANQALWPDRAISLARQTGRATGWDLCLDTTTRRNAICQDLSASCCTPCPLCLSQYDPQWSRPIDCPSDLCEARPKRTSQEASFNAGGAGCPPWALFSHWRSHSFLGSCWCDIVPTCGMGNLVRVYPLLSPI